MAGDGVHRVDEHLFDVDVLALVFAARLVAAGHEDRRNVQARRRHQLAGHGLVARGQADHAVELRAFDRDLDVVGDQVTRRQHVGAACARAGDEVARRRGADLEGHAARGTDRLLDLDRDLVEVAVAGRELGARVDDRDLRFLAVFFRDAHAAPLRVAHRPEVRAAREVAAQLALCHGGLLDCRVVLSRAAGRV
jgi:hypothetical protein